MLSGDFATEALVQLFRAFPIVLETCRIELPPPSRSAPALPEHVNLFTSSGVYWIRSDEAKAIASVRMDIQRNLNN